MLEQKISERAKKLILVKFVERRQQIDKDITIIKQTNNARGMLRSGATLKSINELCAKELEERAMLAWQELRRVYSSLGSPMTETLADDFKQEVQKYIELSYTQLNNVMKAQTENIFSEQERGKIFSLNEAKDFAINKTSAEIDLYVDSIIKSYNKAKFWIYLKKLSKKGYFILGVMMFIFSIIERLKLFEKISPKLKIPQPLLLWLIALICIFWAGFQVYKESVSLTDNKYTEEQ